MTDAAPKRRILVINPNSSLPVTQAIDAAVQPLRIEGGPEVVVDYLREGPSGIATQRDADGVILPLVQRVSRDDADAFVIACFSDPGLHAVREAVGQRPVMGIAEWGLLRALTLGESFGIIALSGASVRRQRRYVRQMGLYDRYAGSWPIDASAEDTAGDAVLDRLAEAGRKLVTQRGADVLILGCAGMAGHRRALQELIGRPVVEPTQQAVAAALGSLLLAAA
jgi:allantoin racemase